MRTFAQKLKATQQPTSAKSTGLGPPYVRQSREVNSMLHLQRAIGSQAAQRVLETKADEPEVGLVSPSSPHLAHDFSQVSVYPKSPPHVQAKLTIGPPGDRYEQEADHVADLVMSMSESRVQRACDCGGSCPTCGVTEKDTKRDLLQTKAMQTGGGATWAAPQAVHKVLGSAGRPLESGTRSFFEPRFGHDFSQVRLHTSQDAAEAAKAVNALAFTVGRNIVFGAGRYQPLTPAGKNLLAHELTHVVQQGGDQNTVMRVCDCAAMGARQPDPSVPLEAGVSTAFPGLVSGDWCVIGPSTATYNCYAWSISDITQWIDSQVDSQYGDKNGTLSFSDFDAFYQQTQGLSPQAAPDSSTMVALFAKGSAPQHAALVAGAQACGSIPFTSKLGQGPLIAHDLYQLEGSTYGKVGRYYA